jgi:hypothetical protein
MLAQIGSDLSVDNKDASMNSTKLPPTPPDEAEVPLYTIDDILLQRISYPPDAPLVGYPQTRYGISDYAFYTAKELDKFANGAARALQFSGFPKVGGF